MEHCYRLYSWRGFVTQHISTNIGYFLVTQIIRIQYVLIKKNLNKIRSQKWMAFIIIPKQNTNRIELARTWSLELQPSPEDGRQPCKMKHKPQIHENPRTQVAPCNDRIQTNASFEILLLGRHPPWLAKRMARASSSPLILVILVITKTCWSPFQ